MDPTWDHGVGDKEAALNVFIRIPCFFQWVSMWDANSLSASTWQGIESKTQIAEAEWAGWSEWVSMYTEWIWVPT